MARNKDSDWFRAQLQGVRPLAQEKRVPIRREDVSELARAARREAATREESVDDNGLSTADIDLLDPHYPLEFRRDGVQHGVFRKLKQGRYSMDARLDLHRVTVEQARLEVWSFIRQAMEYDLRTLLIVPGKGSHAQSEGAVLKSYLNRWLRQIADVQAFVSAQPQHGGVGAVYVMLKKSERKKQENRDRFAKGRQV